ncbi:MAG: hypothetical protein AAF086_08230 [Planctomycetota bacterium]
MFLTRSHLPHLLRWTSPSSFWGRPKRSYLYPVDNRQHILAQMYSYERRGVRYGVTKSGNKPYRLSAESNLEFDLERNASSVARLIQERKTGYRFASPLWLSEANSRIHGYVISQGEIVSWMCSRYRAFQTLYLVNKSGKPEIAIEIDGRIWIDLDRLDEMNERILLMSWLLAMYWKSFD